LPLGLHGEHQAANAAGVVAAVEQLREAGLTMPDRAVHDGFRDVVWPARMELLSRRPVVVIDCAHNVASAEALVRTMEESFPVAGHRHLVFSSSTDKQIAEMLAVLAPHFDSFHLTRYRSNPRSADPEAVARILRELGKTDVHVLDSPEDAWTSARMRAGPDDGVVVAGSVFLAGELRPRMLRDCQS
jgi:dihydrofolate synthase / folylpolyglutamate synthase